MRSENKTTPRDAVLRLIEVAGGQSHASALLGVTQQSVSGYTRDGTIPARVRERTAALMADYDTRRAWFTWWVGQQAWRRDDPYWTRLVVDFVDQMPNGTGKLTNRVLHAFQKNGIGRGQIIDYMASGYMGWAMVVSGSFVVFYKPGDGCTLQAIAYIDSTEARPAFDGRDPLLGRHVTRVVVGQKL